MPVLKSKQTQPTLVKPGLTRQLIYTGDLMTVIIDFTNGPWDEPELPHKHPHVQTSYVAKGEIIFYCEGEPDQHLVEGDLFAVPAHKLHTVKLLTKEVRLVDSFCPIREDFL